MASIIDILPIEIIEHIIDLVAFDDHQSGPHNPLQFRNVKACALTCRAFYPRSRYQRFSAVKVYDLHPFIEHAKGTMTLDEFVRFVKTYPDNAREVRELHYSIRGRSMKPLSWRLMDDEIPKNLSNLRSLVLTSYRGSMDWDYNVTTWDADDQRHDDPLLQIMHLPTLVSLKIIRAYAFRPGDLFPCTNLKRLSLQSVSVFPEDDERSSVIIKRTAPIKDAVSICLEYLEVGGSAIKTVAEMTEPAVEGECPILDLQYLKELKVKGGLQEQYLPSTKKIFKHARQLQSIQFEIGRQTSFENVTDMVSLISRTRATLRHLSIDLYLIRLTDEEYIPDKDNFRSLLLALALLGSQAREAKLTSLQIQIRIGPSECGWFPDEEWHWLQVILLVEGWFSSAHFDLALLVQGQSARRRSIVRILSKLPHTVLSVLSSQKASKFTFFCGKEGQYVPRKMDQVF